MFKGNICIHIYIKQQKKKIYVKVNNIKKCNESQDKEKKSQWMAKPKSWKQVGTSNRLGVDERQAWAAPQLWVTLWQKHLWGILRQHPKPPNRPRLPAKWLHRLTSSSCVSISTMCSIFFLKTSSAQIKRNQEDSWLLCEALSPHSLPSTSWFCEPSDLY